MKIDQTIKIKRGLDLPITGSPEQTIQKGRGANTVAILGDDYVGMRPTMLVNEGDRVQQGQALFEDKKNPGVLFTAPAAGRVTGIHRGERRTFVSVIVEKGEGGAESFPRFSGQAPDSIGRDDIEKVMIQSGLWPAFRTRPFSRTPVPGSAANSIFVSALDTHPLSANPEVVIAEHPRDFENGLRALTAFTATKVYLAVGRDSKVPCPDHPKISANTFLGNHPAGLVGTHIHFLDPVGPKKTVWHIGYQDVIALGKLLEEGSIWNERVVSVAGPRVREPRLIRSELGACLGETLRGALEDGPSRTISGSVFGGRRADFGSPDDFLGRFHVQVSVVEEDHSRSFLGWQMPGSDQYSTRGVFLSKLMGKKFAFTTSKHGSPRSMVPVGMFENVMPLDILPTFLLRALVSQEIEDAQNLGALELDEEDLGLCTFVCPGKTDYGPPLRSILTTIEKEG